MIKRGLSLKQREKELISLIEDAEGLKFNDILLNLYKNQLGMIQREIKEIKEVDNKVYTNRVKKGVENEIKHPIFKKANKDALESL